MKIIISFKCGNYGLEAEQEGINSSVRFFKAIGRRGISFTPDTLIEVVPKDK